MANAQRVAQVGEQIKAIVARRLERGIKDPRLGFVTITDVRMTGDLQHASIFYTVYGTDDERADTAAALKSATGMLRTEVGKHVRMRLTPSLEFIPDGVPENASAIDRLLREARDRDAETSAAASSASYAGEEDPYRKPRELDDEFSEGPDGEDSDDERDSDPEGGPEDDAARRSDDGAADDEGDIVRRR